MLPQKREILPRHLHFALQVQDLAHVRAIHFADVRPRGLRNLGKRHGQASGLQRLVIWPLRECAHDIGRAQHGCKITGSEPCTHPAGQYERCRLRIKR